MPLVRIDGTRLQSWDAFHSAFASAFGFPDFYGRNMDAWIDCMTSLDSPGTG
jgi:RNAse (barnase) inhibitor barstar